MGLNICGEGKMTIFGGLKIGFNWKKEVNTHKIFLFTWFYEKKIKNFQILLFLILKPYKPP